MIGGEASIPAAAEHQGPIVVVDLGNTHLRVALAEGFGEGRASRGVPPCRLRLQRRVSSRVIQGAGSETPVPPLVPWLDAWLQVVGETLGQTHAPWCVASVNPPMCTALSAELSHRGIPVRVLMPIDFGMPMEVEAPSRVGVDRVAAAAAASFRLGDAGSRSASTECAPGLATGLIVVDAGTAITVDVVSPRGSFLGGAILPGPETQLRQMASATGQLPSVSWHPTGLPPPPLGRHTIAAMESGVFWGCVGAVRELIAKLREDQEAMLPTIATGGWGVELARHVEFTRGYEPDLVLEGAFLAAMHGCGGIGR